jgi:uroporphyrin-III C-methyltransferase
MIAADPAVAGRAGNQRSDVPGTTVARPGTVYLVGAGPGAPDLLTLRAARLLASAGVVFHDALVHPQTLALAARADKVAVGKRYGRYATAQRFIDKRLVDAARAGLAVVRLKGGDPMLFGRAQEEIAALERAGVPFEIVPGVTAALAAAAELRTSLTQRGSVRSFSLVTPRVGAGEPASNRWLTALAGADAGAIYMGAGEPAAIAVALIANGKPADLPVARVENASLPDAHVLYTTLGALARGDAPPLSGPALLLVGPQFVARGHRAAAATTDAVANDRRVDRGAAADRAVG